MVAKVTTISMVKKAKTLFTVVQVMTTSLQVKAGTPSLVATAATTSTHKMVVTFSGEANARSLKLHLHIQSSCSGSRALATWSTEETTPSSWTSGVKMLLASTTFAWLPAIAKTSWVLDSV